MKLSTDLQREVEQWALTLGVSPEQFMNQAVSERLLSLRREHSKSVELRENNKSTFLPRLYRKGGILVVETEQLSEFDINAYISQMREERIQEEIGKINIIG